MSVAESEQRFRTESEALAILWDALKAVEKKLEDKTRQPQNASKGAPQHPGIKLYQVVMGEVHEKVQVMKEARKREIIIAAVTVLLMLGMVAASCYLTGKSYRS